MASYREYSWKLGWQFAAAGSASNPPLYIKGRVKGCTFISEEFTGSMNDPLFWHKLRTFAKDKKSFVYLMR